MSRSIQSHTLLLAAVSLAASCGSSTAPGDPNGNLDVEFLNFTGQSAAMAIDGQAAVVVLGNPSNGNPTIYKVTNPGLGNSLRFTANWNGGVLEATCTVSDITGISVPPSVVIQPLGFLDCSGW